MQQANFFPPLLVAGPIPDIRCLAQQTTDANEIARLCLGFEKQMLNLFSKDYFYTKACCMKDEGYKIRDEYGVYYLTFAVVEWIDVFSRRIYADIVLDSLKFCI